MFPGAPGMQDDGGFPSMFGGAPPDPYATGYIEELPAHKRCNCKKAKCLKLYCVCFSAGVYCAGCLCKECMNTPAHQDAVMFERNRILQRSPRAFAPKVEQKMTGDITHKKGCRCRKSRCLKKYCECYDAGVHCSNICRCDDCHNRPDMGGAVMVGPDACASLGGTPPPEGHGVILVPATRATKAHGMMTRNTLGMPIMPNNSDEPTTPLHQADEATGHDGAAVPSATLHLGPPGTTATQARLAAQHLPQAMEEMLHHATADTPDHMAILADLKPTNSLPCEPPFSGGLPILHMPASSLGLPGISSSLGPSPMLQAKMAAATASSGSLPHPDNISAPSDLLGKPGAEPGPPQQESNLQRMPTLRPEPSPFHLVQAAAALHPTPAMNNAAAGPGGLELQQPNDLGMLLMPEMLLQDPEYAHMLAMHLGLDETHQMAAVKAAQILNSMLNLARSHPAFAGIAPQPKVAPVCPPTAVQAPRSHMHGLHTVPEEEAHCEVVTRAGLASTPLAMQHQGSEAAVCTSTGGGMLWAQRPPMTGTHSRAVTSGPGSANGGAVRLGSGSFRFAGVAAQARTSDSGCKFGHGDSALGPQASAGMPVMTLGAGLSVGAGPGLHSHAGITLDFSMAPESLALLGTGNAFSAGTHVLQPSNSLKRGGPMMRADACEMGAGQRIAHAMPPTGGVTGVDIFGMAGDAGHVATSSMCTELGHAAKRARMCDDMDGTGMLEVTSGHAGQAANHVMGSPNSKARSAGRPRRSSLGRNMTCSNPRARGSKTMDVIDSVNEIEALQALFDLGSRGSQGTPMGTTNDTACTYERI